MKNASVLLAISLIMWGCNSPAAQNNTPGLPPPITITTASVTHTEMVTTVSIFGVVHLRQEAYLGSQFDGRLDDFSLLPGDRVRKGQRIGTIVPPAREALLQVLDEMPLSSRPNIKKQIRSIPLVSTMDGVVLEVMRHTGGVVQKGEQIVHIGALSALDIRGDLPVRYLPTIRKTKKITVSFVDYPHVPLVLSLQAISGQINETNQTVMIRLKLDNREGKFRPGMLVKLSFDGNHHLGALVIPRKALLEEGGQYAVFVLNGKTVEKRTVTPGIMQDEQIEILSGVSANERVVTGKAYSLEDGMEVQVK